MEKLDFIDSKFRLAILAAKRGKQLLAGAKKRVDTTAENPLTIAIEEIYRGKIKFRILEDDEQIIKDEEPTSLMLGNVEDAIEYENNLDEILHSDDDDSEDFRRDDY